MMMNFRGGSNNSSNNNSNQRSIFDVDNNNSNFQYNQNDHRQQQQLFNFENMMMTFRGGNNNNNNNVSNISNNNERSIFDVDNNNNNFQYQNQNHRQQLLFNIEEEEQQLQQRQHHHYPDDADVGLMTSLMNKGSTTTTKQQHSSKEKDNNVEDLLANTMTKMSLMDREEGLHDLHGVSSTNGIEGDHHHNKEDNNKSLKSKIDDLDEVLAYNSIMMSGDYHPTNGHNNNQESSSSSIEAYEKAVELCPSYVDRIKIMILRSESYDIEKSANRIMRFFTFKLMLFGIEKLTKDDITLDDLDESSLEFLYSGGMQLLNQRDRAGRGIIFSFRNDSKFSTESVMKVFYYLIMSALQDEETQIKGMVFVGYDDYVTNNDNNKSVNRSVAYAECIKALPMRLVAMHVCTNNWKMKYITYLFAKLLEKWNLCRFKLHTGTPMEIIYTLMTFGIPKDTIPVDIDGSINRVCHLEILHALETREKGNISSSNNNKEQQRQQRNASSTMIPVEEEEASLEGPSVVNSSTIDEYVHAISPQSINTATPDSSSKPLSSPNMTATTALVNEAVAVSTTSGSNVPGSTVLIPSPMDVLMGRGRQPQSRPGHVRMRHLLWENIDAYNIASKREKTKLTNSILIQLKESGVRFLRQQQSSSSSKQGGGIYIICNDNDAKEKISHGFRHLRSIKRKGDNDNNSGGSSNATRRVGGSDDSVGGDSTSSNKKKRTK